MAERQVAGLDTLDASDTALLDAMRNDEAAPGIVDDTGGAPASPAASSAPDLGGLDDDSGADDGSDNDAGDAPAADRKVDLRALQAERKRRQEEVDLRRKAEQNLEVEKAKFAERLNMLTQAVQATAPQAPAAPAVEIPDINTDPIGHFKALREQDRKLIEEQSAILRGFQEQQQQARAVAELRNWGTAQELEFMQREPSYKDAMDFLMKGRHAELEALGIADQNARAQIINQDVTNIAQTARNGQRNFAEQLYNVALKRGFAAKASEPVVPPLDAAPAVDPATRAQRGRDAATTIGTAGSAPAPSLTPERIANMSEREFGAYLDKIKGNPAALRQLMGA